MSRIRILDGYIRRTVLASTGLALLVLLAVDLFFAVVDEMDDLGQGDYGLWNLLAYVALTLPRRAYELFPAAILLGGLLGLGSLASGSELVVMRAAGVSLGRIAWAVTKVGVVAVVVASLVGEWLAPLAEQEAERNKVLAKTQHTLLSSQYGFWLREGSRFVSARKVLPGPRLQGVRIYEFDSDYRLRDAYLAKSAAYQGDGWVLTRLRHSGIGQSEVTTNRQRQTHWPSLVDPDLIDIVVVDPENLSAVGLYRYVQYMRANNLDARRYNLALWIRLMRPLSALVMVLLALPFVFGPLRDVGAGQRLLVGIGVGVSFYVLNQALNHLGLVYGLPAWVSAPTPPLVFLGLALLGLRRVR